MSARPATRRPFFTNGTLVLMTLAATGLAFGVLRLTSGLGAVTNLDNQHPWGIWIAIDVACGVALAAGGFCTAALVEIFGRERYKPLLRPALLTAWLGYTFVGLGLLFDLGRYWNIWRPAFNWQGNSVLFEVGMCVMAYLTVLTVEMAPTLLRGLQAYSGHEGRIGALLERMKEPLLLLRRVIRAVLPIFIVAGVVLSCMHQSSLGALMLIAPSKLGALWYTPILPALFLLSAIMVAFAMVAVESMVARASFKLDSEIAVLRPLARILPWTIGIYSVVKVGDLLVRRPSLSPAEHTHCFVALMVEMSLGLLLPLLILLLPPKRLSARRIFIASLLVIAGVVINRINVFIIGYHPPFETSTYSPAFGEIAVTIGLIAALMLVYRFFSMFFPVQTDTGAVTGRVPVPQVEPAQSFTAWAARVLAVGFLISFVGFYTVVHWKAEAITGIGRAHIGVVRTPPRIAETPITEHAFRPPAYRNMEVIDHPEHNGDQNDYAPTRFAHRQHDRYVAGNCLVCHHRGLRQGPEDRIGTDLMAMHREEDTFGAGGCDECHESDRSDMNIQRCCVCHLAPNQPDFPGRPGLKAAFHRQCLGCHESANTPNASTECTACHHPLTPDHRELLAFPEAPKPTEVTRRCLECHPQTGEDILLTTHWHWPATSPTRPGMDNFFLFVGRNLPGCAACHIGNGLDADPPGSLVADRSDPAGIDCLVCHDTTGTYRKEPGSDGRPAADVDLAAIAQRVGRPSKETCGGCHYPACNDENAKHGDLDAAFASADPDDDVHLGRYGMICQDCHETREHRIAGLAFGKQVNEGRVGCQSCHGEEPHAISGVLGHHADAHGHSLACQTCHLPLLARAHPTNETWDWSVAGPGPRGDVIEEGATHTNAFGKIGTGTNVVPAYRWYDGTYLRYEVGQEISLDRVTALNTPIGSFFDPGSRITPFRIHRAIQPADAEQKILAIPHFEEGFWEDYDWQAALQSGMEGAGLDWSGELAWVETEMHLSVNHGIVPGSRALGCGDCHAPEAVNCLHCHEGAEDLDVEELTRPRYPGRKFVDFEALNYDGDPAVEGGRFRHLPIPGRK